MFGFGGPSKFLKAFQPCYLVKRVGAAGFLEFDYRYQGWYMGTLLIRNTHPPRITIGP